MQCLASLELQRLTFISLMRYLWTCWGGAGEAPPRQRRNCITRASQTGLMLSQLFLICSVTHLHSALMFVFFTIFSPHPWSLSWFSLSFLSSSSDTVLWQVAHLEGRLQAWPAAWAASPGEQGLQWDPEWESTDSSVWTPAGRIFNNKWSRTGTKCISKEVPLKSDSQPVSNNRWNSVYSA